jgi:hypothetical protein
VGHDIALVANMNAVTRPHGKVPTCSVRLRPAFGDRLNEATRKGIKYVGLTGQLHEDLFAEAAASVSIHSARSTPFDVAHGAAPAEP